MNDDLESWIIGRYLPGPDVPSVFLLSSWGSLFGVPMKVPLEELHWAQTGGCPTGNVVLSPVHRTL